MVRLVSIRSVIIKLMTTFYICRHGQTENNQRRRLMGWIDTPLTESGIKNAKSSAAKLHGIHINKIVSSDLGRSFISAYIIARELGYDDEILLLAGLREHNYGDWANLTYDDPKLEALTDRTFIPPNGESLIAMQTRVIACIQDISIKFPGQSVLVVAHDGTINAIRAFFLKDDIDSSDDLDNAHDFVGKFIIENGKITSFEEIDGKQI